MIIGPVTGAELDAFEQKIRAAIDDLPTAIDPESEGFGAAVEAMVLRSYTRLAETIDSAMLALFAEAIAVLGLYDVTESPAFRDLKDAVRAYRGQVAEDAMSQPKNSAIVGLSASFHVLAEREKRGVPPVNTPSNLKF